MLIKLWPGPTLRPAGVLAYDPTDHPSRPVAHSPSKARGVEPASHHPNLASFHRAPSTILAGTEVLPFSFLPKGQCPTVSSPEILPVSARPDHHQFFDKVSTMCYNSSIENFWQKRGL